MLKGQQVTDGVEKLKQRQRKKVQDKRKGNRPYVLVMSRTGFRVNTHSIVA